MGQKLGQTLGELLFTGYETTGNGWVNQRTGGYTQVQLTKDTTWCCANVNDITKICINLPPSSYEKGLNKIGICN